MLESQRDHQRSALVAAGIPNLSAMKKCDLKAECRKRSLGQHGTKVELQQRLQAFFTSQLQDRSITLPPPQEGEFDWVVCQSGALH